MHRLAIGGVGYAASKLPKNSVRTNINLAKLGTVPSATTAANATNATTASALTPLEAFHAVGAPGQPAFLDGTTNFPAIEGLLFTLPVGFRPASDISLVFPNLEDEETIVRG